MFNTKTSLWIFGLSIGLYKDSVEVGQKRGSQELIHNS